MCYLVEWECFNFIIVEMEKKVFKTDGEALIDMYLEMMDESKEKLVRHFYNDEIKQLLEQAETSLTTGSCSSCILLTRSKEIASIALAAFKKELISSMHSKHKPARVVPITINPLLVKDEERMLAQIHEELADAFPEVVRRKDAEAANLWEDLSAFKDAAILIVLEELEVNVIGKRQGLLYRLFDLPHHGSIKLFSVLVAQNINIAEHFEKRVKSRYSHRFFLASLLGKYCYTKSTLTTSQKPSTSFLI
eukprot:TRINITY_DN12685_c0_g1_i2.p1 TRINITY_DN12685_c0_g1~~TRINITY_DN12685_c0_g1_i2.p1  ORF type:complete len:249 (-),score=65.88 TRINITY_DN12685_c0_g1_i2:741-1487(-)